MVLFALLAVLVAPVHAGVDLRWAPLLEQTLPQTSGRGAEIARGFDGTVRSGLQVRLNEVLALSQVGVRDLRALKRFRRRADAASAGVPLDHLEALERSLKILSPVIARLEAAGARPDDRMTVPAGLPELVSRALIAEAGASEDRALAPGGQKEIDALLRDRSYYLSAVTLERLTNASAGSDEYAVVTPSERLEMRDAVAASAAPSFLRRLLDAARRLFF